MANSAGGRQIPSIEARNLVKKYQTKTGFFGARTFFTAVNDLSFEIHQGETVAFLGPNGAGKSTTIKMLCGILSPTQGEAFISGIPGGKKEASRVLGLVFGTRSQLFMHMTVFQCLDLVSEIYFLSGNTKVRRIQELSELFEISPFLEKRVRSLSLGERMRCEVVAALLHKPKILLADEPTIGLDVIAKNRLRDLILRWQREEKTTLMLTSHDLSDVEALCDRAVLIDKGVKRFDGNLESLKGNLADVRRIQITASDVSLAEFSGDQRIVRTSQGEHCYEVRTKELPMSDALARLSSHYGDKLQDIQISEVGLEEVLQQIYQGKA